MKKFNIRKVLDGLTAVSSSSSSSASPPAGNPASDAVAESLQSEHFQLCKTMRHGFPYQPSAMAFDPVQKILAIGTQNGALRLFGRPGVECYCQHDSGAAVIQLQFLINEGALVSALADDSIHLWNLRQKRPAILHSLKFNRERITFCHLPFQSKWLYVGTERGNIHIVNVESFTLSGYVIMWNKAIELSSKAHPGPVVHISDNPMDEGKLIIGFESGIVVLWDLKSKKADYRYTYDEVRKRASRRAPRSLPFINALQKYYRRNEIFMATHSSASMSKLCPGIFALTNKCLRKIKIYMKTFAITNFLSKVIHNKKKNAHKSQNRQFILLEIRAGVLSAVSTRPRKSRAHFMRHITAVRRFQLCYSSGWLSAPQRNGRKDTNRSLEFNRPLMLLLRNIRYPFLPSLLQLLEVRLQYELSDTDSPEMVAEQQSLPGSTSSPQTSAPPSHPSTSSSSSDGIRDNVPCLKVRSAPLKQSPGYQVELVVQLVWVSGEPPQQVTSLAVNSSYGLLAFGNSNGLAIVDYLQKTVLLNLGTVELYGSNDPYQRQPRSPRKSRQPSGGLCDISEGSTTSEDRCKSPTSGKRWSASAGRGSARFVRDGCCTSLLSRPTVLLSVCPLRAAVPPDARDSSFSRSRSSSVTSIDKEAREAITALHFADTFARRGESCAAPTLWVGTSLGTVLAVALSLPPPGEQRLLQPVIVSPSGTQIRLKGSILRMAFLDSAGAILPPAHEAWYEPNAHDEREEREKARKRRPVSVSPSASQDLGEIHYAVVCSEKQAKVLALPTQSCVFKHNITETSFVLRSDVVQMSNGVCLTCFCANGHIMALSLPSLRPLLDVNYLPLTDMRIARTFCFSNHGQAMYLTSPTEIQRITYSQEMCENLQEMLGELFTPVETPEAPNRGFFKGLFGGGAQSLDREELFGEFAAGKASRSLAQHIPGPGGIEGMKGAASGVVGELARARIALDERGQKLGELEERTAAMMASADSFSKHAHDMMLKCKDKKWYQF
ncbi:syntaxin-binding protein 5 isoform X1 [Arapaima gigas]